MVERREAEEEIRLTAMRQAATIGMADVAAACYRMFDMEAVLRDRLADVADETLGCDSSGTDAGVV